MQEVLPYLPEDEPFQNVKSDICPLTFMKTHREDVVPLPQLLSVKRKRRCGESHKKEKQIEPVDEEYIHKK